VPVLHLHHPRCVIGHIPPAQGEHTKGNNESVLSLHAVGTPVLHLHHARRRMRRPTCIPPTPRDSAHIGIVAPRDSAHIGTVAPRDRAHIGTVAPRDSAHIGTVAPRDSAHIGTVAPSPRGVAGSILPSALSLCVYHLHRAPICAPARCSLTLIGRRERSMTKRKTTSSKPVLMCVLSL